MTEAHFGDIRQLILNELKNAKHDIYVAVAWITDKQLMQILIDKQKEEIDIIIILVKDEINENNKFDYSGFIEAGGKIYWDNHHHKFCVIDRNVVITGSYNWTYSANSRTSRENIIISNEKELIDKYSSEFKLLKKQSTELKLEAKVEYIEVERIIEVEKIIEIEKRKGTETSSENKRNLEPTKSKEKYFGQFQGSYVKCGKCNSSLNQENQCENCKISYIYNATTNKYESK